MCEHCDEATDGVAVELNSENIKNLAKLIIDTMQEVVDAVDNSAVSKMVELDLTCNAMSLMYSCAGVNGPLLRAAWMTEKTRIASIASQN